MMKSLGVRGYRFSISWSRVIPKGGRNDPINPEALRFYSNLVDELIANGIEPMVTLFHWDLPQALHDRYGGFLNQDEYVMDYVWYARVMFEALGDRVRHWITYNEPWCTSILGYSTGVFAPGRSSDRSRCSEGDSAVEPWRVAHTILVAHGAAVKIYRDEFKQRQGGQIGMTLNGDWAEPWDAQDPADIEAAQRKHEFSIAWFADPLYYGDYPTTMKQQLGDRLPTFTAAERILVQGSNDFYGMNHYSVDYVRHRITVPPSDDFFGNVDMLKTNRDGKISGPETSCSWLTPNASGFRNLLNWISKRYNRPSIYVTENGTCVKGENDLSLEMALQDDFRAKYFQDYIRALAEAYTYDNVDVRGYMAWSLLEFVVHRPFVLRES